MISNLAISDLRKMEKDGLHPSPEDVIRLNALGLKLEAFRKRFSTSSLEYLPRVAAITPTISFRQPTVGHEIWLAKVESFIDPSYETFLAVRAFALSRPPSALPDPYDPMAVKNAVEEYAVNFRDVTRDQIYAALDYVIYGASPTLGELPLSTEPQADEAKADPFAGEDWNRCVALGSLHEAEAVLWGIDRRELEAMTRRQLEDLIERAYVFHDIDRSPGESMLMSDYYSTLDAIRARLEKEGVKDGRAEN